jgi:hypothetical protein
MNKEMKNIMTNSIMVFLIIALVYIGGIGTAKITKDMRAIEVVVEEDTTKFDKKQIIKTKQDIEYTNTTQDERTYEELLSIEPDYIYYDTTGSQREADSIDAYMKYWYEVLDTNSDGEIDDIEGMDCGGKVHDSIIEWLEE